MPKSPDLGHALSRAMTSFVVIVTLALVLGLVLESRGGERWAFALAWTLNPVTAWFIADAARAAGKNPWFWGTLSVLGPPLSLHAWFSLHREYALSR
jgi:multisubunit Na+/H+ antiporter MnhG subunit